MGTREGGGAWGACGGCRTAWVSSRRQCDAAQENRPGVMARRLPTNTASADLLTRVSSLAVELHGADGPDRAAADGNEPGAESAGERAGEDRRQLGPHHQRAQPEGVRGGARRGARKGDEPHAHAAEEPAALMPRLMKMLNN
eukprot:1025485-Prorocentrum_minimum.AAC.1